VIGRILRAIAVALACHHAGAATLDVARDVGFDQHLSAMLPLAARFVDDRGNRAPLVRFLEGRPAVLVLGYYGCPNLCNPTRQSLMQSLSSVGLDASQFSVVAVSIDPSESPQRAAALGAAASTGNATWHYLAGDADAVSALAQAVGFHYRYDTLSQQYLHPAGIVIVTSQGRIARYFFGVNFPPKELRRSLLDAAHDHVESPVEQWMLLCFHYDPASGRYSGTIGDAMRALGVLVVFGLGGLILALRQR
jgi:protein SCO1/2